MLIVFLLASLLCSSEAKTFRTKSIIDAKINAVDVKDSQAQSLVKFGKDKKSNQPSGATTVTHESFFERMSNAIGEFLAGLILIVFSLPVIWFNEKRNAQFETLINRGERACRKVEDGEYDSKNTNWPVHATGHTSSSTPVEDSQFNVRFDSGVIKLTHHVEIYQWQEQKHESKEEKETLGGGRETKTFTWYTYEKKWLSTYNDGREFNERDGHDNRKPRGIEEGSATATCEQVRFGKGFLLSGVELGQLGTGKAFIPDKLCCKKNDELLFVEDMDGYSYAREDGVVNACNPEIGDVRVHFDWLKDDEITVVGLQSEGTGQIGEGGFLPFRVIQHPICSCSGLSEEQEQEMLRKEAEKPPLTFASEATWGGLGWCFCCPCNLVAMCYAAAFHPELHHVYLGKISKTECFSRIGNSAIAQKWSMRVVGWLIMYVGLCCVFSPFTTLLKVIPFIGPFLSSLSGAITGAFSFIVTVVVATFIISLAYVVYHPRIGLLLLIFGCLVCAVACTLAVAHRMKLQGV